MKFKTLTLQSSQGTFQEIVTDVGVAAAVEDLQVGAMPQMTYWTTCLWDTGGTHSSITKKTAEILGLAPIGEARVVYGNGVAMTKTYLVSLVLPDLLFLPRLQVTESDTDEGFGVILGMDVICRGDLAITNVDGVSTFSFCVPSLERIDFAERIRGLGDVE